MSLRPLWIVGPTLLWLVGCTAIRTATPTPAPSPTAVPPTPVPRLLATSTPEPLAAVPSVKLSGIVVPASAQLLSFVPADEATDAQAEYLLPSVDLEVARDWFRRELPKVGWRQPEEIDGTLLFVHDKELSAQHAREGLGRHALFLFEATEDGVKVTINVEAAN